ncbi:DNA-3-methyladenine glycosylase I [Erwinia aphidicola]
MGPVATYSLMQALGLVNDHLAGCCIRAECEAERSAAIRPS